LNPAQRRALTDGSIGGTRWTFYSSWCGLFVTSCYDVLLIFPNQFFVEFGTTYKICIIAVGCVHFIVPILPFIYHAQSTFNLSI